MIGITSSVICAVYMMLFVFRLPHWETVNFPSSEALRLYFENLLHILCGGALLGAITATTLSTFLFWKLRAEQRHLTALTGLVLNLICTIIMVGFAILHPRWETVPLTPEEVRPYFEGMLHLVGSVAMSVLAAVMAFSAFLFWKLRK